jgi:hypothetical protein
VQRRRTRWEPWLALGLFGFLLHLVWELLQAPFYELETLTTIPDRRGARG